jgi:hypothetical protein
MKREKREQVLEHLLREIWQKQNWRSKHTIRSR